MKTFDQWFNQTWQELTEVAEEPTPLEKKWAQFEDVLVNKGVPYTMCCRCQEISPIDYTPEEHVPNAFYCGRSSRCCP